MQNIRLPIWKRQGNWSNLSLATKQVPGSTITDLPPFKVLSTTPKYPTAALFFLKFLFNTVLY